MWNFITSPGGHQRYVKWMTGLFVEIKDVKHFKAHPQVKFLNTEVLRSIHKVRNNSYPRVLLSYLDRR
jgi:hypothetical protein